MISKRFALIFLLTSSAFAFGQESPVVIYEWEEVQQASPDTIFGLSLSKLKLTELPEEVKKYKYLKELHLQKNKLDRLPDFITDFEYLEVLNLEKNELEIFPLQICRMNALKRLSIGKNYFEQIPECIGNVQTLEYIDLIDTPINKLPESLVTLKNLQEIDFTGIRFSPNFQESWTKLLPNVKLVFDAPCDCMN